MHRESSLDQCECEYGGGPVRCRRSLHLSAFYTCGAVLDAVEEDPDGEFGASVSSTATPNGPRVINVGVPGPGPQVALWRRAWRDKVQTRLRHNSARLLRSFGYQASALQLLASL